MNRVELHGGLTRDPEFRFTDSGVAVWEVTLAVNGTRYDSQARQQVVRTTFVRVVAFGHCAEQAAESGLAKGDSVLILGELDNHTRERQDGSKETKTSVAALTVTPTRIRSARPSAPRQEQQSDPWAMEREPEGGTPAW